MLTPDSGFSSDSSLNLIEIRNLQQQITDITIAKEVYLRNALTVSNTIETMTHNMLAAAESREHSLKSQLIAIKNAKVTEWSRQLKLCQDALTAIRTADRSSLNAISDYFAKNIGFIDAGEIKLTNKACDTLLEEVRNFGSICETPTPRVLIRGVGKPWGVCCDSFGRVLITNRGNHNVNVYSINGEWLFCFGKFGTRFGAFNNPVGITTDDRRRILVADKDNHRIQIFNFAGRFLKSFGRRGAKVGEFLHPWDVAVDGSGHIAVSENRNQRIQLFNPNGCFIAKFCLQAVFLPFGVAFKPDDSLLVTDPSNGCVYLINKLFSHASRIHSGFGHPQAVACCSNGVFAIADTKLIQMFDKDGNIIGMIDIQEVERLTGLCLLQDGKIIAVDSDGGRVIIL